MADPTTELAKEFLEFQGYIVKKESKFIKNKELKGTAGDIDIIAISSKGVDLGEFKLKREIVAEVKSWKVMTKEQFNEIYDDKFKYINNYKISWRQEQLKKYFSSKKFDRILFCGATTDEVYEYALKKGVRIITSGFIIKKLCDIFTESGKRTYYPEAYNFDLIRTIIDYLLHSHKFKDKLTLKDFIWIKPDEEPQYRNKFNKLNGEFMADFLYYDNENLISLMREDPEWFLNEILNIWEKKNKKQLIKRLQKKLKKLS